MSDKRYEDIEKIIEKANVTFAEAKEAYEKCGQDLLETLIYLEKKSKLKKKSKGCKYKNVDQDSRDGFTKAESFFKRLGTKLLKRNFIAYNDNKVFINMPLIVVLLIFLFSLPQSMFLLFLVILTGCRLKVVNNNKTDKFYHSFEENIKNGVSDIKKAFEETIKTSDESKKNNQEEKKEDDFEIDESKEDDFEEVIID